MECGILPDDIYMLSIYATVHLMSSFECACTGEEVGGMLHRSVLW